MKLKTTKVFRELKKAFDNPLYNVIALHGGTRAGKTFGTLQFLIVVALLNPNKIITITGKSMNWLKRGPERDLKDILVSLNYYEINRHNLSNHTYTFPNGAMIEFLSTEDEEKLKGPGRFIIFCNEGNSLSQGAFLQLAGRTENKILIDYNPSFRKDHWLYKTLEDEKTASLHFTYLDNPFLSKIQIEHITNMINYDINYHRIYVLGLPATEEDKVYNHFKSYKEIPKEETVILTSYGLDFGFNDPTALVEVKKTNLGRYYCKELIYESNLTSTDLINKLKALNIKGSIYCDTARPEIITDMLRSGFTALKADKKIKAGIDSIRASEIYLHEDSLNAWNEVENYLWKKVNDILTDEPIDKFNHCFIGSTLITTENGLVPIKDIKVNDRVLTSKGYNKVLLKHNNGLKRVNKYKLHLEDEIIELNCTKEHKIKTTEGWKMIKDLKAGSYLLQHKSLMEKPTTCIKTKSTLVEDVKDYTELSGKTLMEQYQKDTIFTTLMELKPTTDLKIFNLLKVKNIFQHTVNNILKIIQSGLKHFIQKESKQLKSGIQHQKELSGTNNTVLKVGKIEKSEHLFVKCVKKNILQDTVLNQSTVIKTVKLLHLDVEESWKEQVYDITVENEHEYFANEILVHNCMDSLRYCIFKIKDITNNSSKYKSYAI